MPENERLARMEVDLCYVRQGITEMKPMVIESHTRISLLEQLHMQQKENKKSIFDSKMLLWTMVLALSGIAGAGVSLLIFWVHG